jgi:NhaP-type Na+/H+ or K+/H+ antiporter
MARSLGSRSDRFSSGRYCCYGCPAEDADSPPIIAILEGESLVNDSIALVVYRFGIAAVVTGTLSLTDAVLKIPVVAIGGVLVGWALAAGVHWLQRHLDDPPGSDYYFVSHTVCGVSARRAIGSVRCPRSGSPPGFISVWGSPLITARTRLEAFSFLRMIVFLLNGIIFILIGLQLPAVVSACYRIMGEASVLRRRGERDRGACADSLGILGSLPAAPLPRENAS